MSSSQKSLCGTSSPITLNVNNQDVHMYDGRTTILPHSARGRPRQNRSSRSSWGFLGCVCAGAVGAPKPPSPPSPLAPMPIPPPVTGERTAGDPPPIPVLPNIETRSSSGLLDVRIFAVAGFDAAPPPMMSDARPCDDEGIPEPELDPTSGSSKSSRFSACCPCTTVLSAFSRERTSSSRLQSSEELC